MNIFTLAVSNVSGDPIAQANFKSPHTLKEMIGMYRSAKSNLTKDDETYYSIVFSRQEVEFVVRQSLENKWLGQVLKKHDDEQFIFKTTLLKNKLRLV